MKSAKIIGTGRYVPDHLYTTTDLEKLLGEPLKPSIEQKL